MAKSTGNVNKNFAARRPEEHIPGGERESKKNIEKIPEHRPIDLAFERRQPLQIEIIGPDPSETPEFLVGGGDVQVALRRGKREKKILLLLAVITLLRPALAEHVTVRPFSR